MTFFSQPGQRAHDLCTFSGSLMARTQENNKVATGLWTPISKCGGGGGGGGGGGLYLMTT